MNQAILDVLDRPVCHFREHGCDCFGLAADSDPDPESASDIGRIEHPDLALGQFEEVRQDHLGRMRSLRRAADHQFPVGFIIGERILRISYSLKIFSII